MNTASRFQLFSIITKCIRSFLDSNVRKQISFHRERTSAGEEGQHHTGSLYQCLTEEGGGPKKSRGGSPEEDDGGGTDVR
jgi:hypothetical protein